ncbi:unnamed protein product, partial [Mesorhabditis spiculigera]
MEPNDDTKNNNPCHQAAEIKDKEDTPKVSPVQTAEEEDVDLEWFYDMANIFPWIRYWKYKGEEPVDSDDEEAQRKPDKKEQKAAGASDPKPSTSKSSETNGRARKRQPAPESDGSDLETPPRRSRKRAETPDWEMPTKSKKARNSNGSEGERRPRGRPRKKVPIWPVDEPVSHCQDEQHDMLELFTRDHHCETCGVDLKVRASETGQRLVNHAITHIDGDHHDGEQYEFNGRLVTMRDPMFSREVKRVAAASFPAYKEDCADYVNEKRKQPIEEHQAGNENQDKPPHENDQEMSAVVKNECQTCMKKLAVQPQASLNTINLIKHSMAHLDYRPFKCPHCPSLNRLKEEVTRHVRAHHFARRHIAVVDFRTETYFADLTATVMANFPLQADELIDRITADKEELFSNGTLERDETKLLLTVASDKDVLGLAAGRPRRTRIPPPRFASATSASTSATKTFLETACDDQGPPEIMTGRPSRIRKPPPRLGFDHNMPMDDDDNNESDYEEVCIAKKTQPRPGQRRPKNVATLPSNQVKYRPRVPPPRPFANRRLTPPSEIDPLALLAIISELFKADVPAGTYEAAAAGGLYKDFYPRLHRSSARFEQPADDGDKFDAVNNNLNPFSLPEN